MWKKQFTTNRAIRETILEHRIIGERNCIGTQSSQGKKPYSNRVIWETSFLRELTSGTESFIIKEQQAELIYVQDWLDVSTNYRNS